MRSLLLAVLFAITSLCAQKEAVKEPATLTWQGAIVANFAAIIFGVYRVGVYAGLVKDLAGRVKTLEAETVTEDHVSLAKTTLQIEIQALRLDLIQLMAEGRHGLRNEMQVAIGESTEQISDRIDDLKSSTEKRIDELRGELGAIAGRLHEKRGR